MTNLMKTAAFAAVLGMSATAATAAGFGFQTTVNDDSAITLDLVRADEAGVVVIYDYTGGEFGDVLGSADINAGANTDVIIPLDNNIAQELAAVIYAGPMSEPSMAANWIELDVTE
ncbi:hypothetical protein SAMN04488515_2977 [Cognatiyoonia koreensis]|uniref:DUF7282 domain-containing protein n=1 Tax=Cognatiyoonia koreensis TaxID=364200 RepID=A0A1I0RPG5_9RHOB|nr:hypothetical protein [Cognatiyoonia koreensis]SEW42561.1 hypothetical protein SAMN04488515_2977 [Cognatiyoonia koreensis]